MFDELILCWHICCSNQLVLFGYSFGYFGSIHLGLKFLHWLSISLDTAVYAPPALLFPCCLVVLVALLPGVLGSQVSLSLAGVWGPRDLYASPAAGGTGVRVAAGGGWVPHSALVLDASGHKFHLPLVEGGGGWTGTLFSVPDPSSPSCGSRTTLSWHGSGHHHSVGHFSTCRDTASHWVTLMQAGPPRLGRHPHRPGYHHSTRVHTWAGLLLPPLTVALMTA